MAKSNDKTHQKNGQQLSYFTFRYINDVLSLHNSILCDYVERIHIIELEIGKKEDYPTIVFQS